MILHRSIDEVFRSWSNVAVIRALQDTASGFSGREVARVAGMSIRSALQALTSLENLGIVRRQRGGRDHIFTLNRNHYLVEQCIIPLFAIERRFLENIRTFIAEAVKGQALSVILFGSVARGEETPQSDLDICCIVKNKSQQKRLQSILDGISPALLNRFGVKIGPIFFTLTEFKKNALKQNRLTKEILVHGEIITGKNLKVLLNA